MTERQSRDAIATVIQRQIDALGERMEAGFKRLEDRINDFEGRVRSVEHSEAACQPMLSGRIDAAWRQIEANTATIKSLVETQTRQQALIGELQHSNKIMSWVAGIAGGSLIMWFITQLLGLI